MTQTLKSLGFIAAISFSSCLYSAAVSSETVAIPLGQQGDYWNVKRPATGTTKSEVVAQYGEPNDASAPVGTPPISAWTYADFIVYFEYDHVIHSVVVAKPNQ